MEHLKAKAWRESLGLSRQRLADLTGYSRESIYWYEKGAQPPTKREGGGKPTPEWIAQRYKLTCAGVARQIETGKNFNWGE